ncbi:hyaluronidase PH-20 isoform X2 [Vombatus ursinus]|uniref:Hyaluronidase n=2 Tax=Vombatus ursinus TaxID=29139 RepID=A0A4X2K3A0_VOMUR|nr:hyaluronidase PH-20 isoform X2 [Vombatus ursinus]
MGMQKITQMFIGSYMTCSKTYYLVITILLLPYYRVLTFRAPPVVPNLPFIMGWNAPTEICAKKFKLPLDLSLFSFVGSTLKTVTNQNITMFYQDRLGYYPYIHEKTGKALNEGIPQLASLKKHLDKAKKDILYYIPAEDTFGLVIIDWENWRPNWVRNWKPKNIYQILSVELIHQLNIKLKDTEAWQAAKKDFEKAARTFMQETLRLGKSLRPNHLWGYYLFPDCYNYNFKSPSYNGSCFDVEKERNNDLYWLWKESTALFPSIYISKKLKYSYKTQFFVRNRIKEAIRVSQVMRFKKPLPIFVYARPVFTDATSQYLSEDDLVNTIGESVALGVSGIIMWGSLNLTQNKKTCMVLDNYMMTTLNPYIINVTLAAKMCSQALCQEQGVCIRKHWNSSDYLHLNPKRFIIQTRKDRRYVIYGKPNLQDLQEFSEKFYCNCYAGSNCKTKVTVQNVRDVKVCISEDICIEAYLDSKPIGHTSRSLKWRRVIVAPQNFLSLDPTGIEDQLISTIAFDGYGIGNGDSSNNGSDSIETTLTEYIFGMNYLAEGTHADTENGMPNSSFQQTPGLYQPKPENNLINTIYSRSCSVFMNFCTYKLFIFLTVELFLSTFVFMDM